jgi:hypothetical protein
VSPSDSRGSELLLLRQTDLALVWPAKGLAGECVAGLTLMVWMSAGLDVRM